ncbi:Flagellar protein FliS [Aquicella siphonis]|uniref:Flagellar protein FliS n=1 Tax=Aquicella siphonis TaxID=254247 RepID=A0A5E4PLF0_9COXI|nr:flagellar export chaperone FliS [Aquicella siphonis]VVC77092.1 Flagellar protein FliS [Aquicella siphonis]
MKSSNDAYAEIETTTDVMTASSHRLIQLMIDKCLQHIELAKTHLLAGDIQKKCQSIAKALDIVEYLRICLNHNDERSKDLSSLLDALYAYLQKNLVQANIKNDIHCLDEAKKILGTLKEGWDGIG